MSDDQEVSGLYRKTPDPDCRSVVSATTLPRSASDVSRHSKETTLVAKDFSRNSRGSSRKTSKGSRYSEDAGEDRGLFVITGEDENGVTGGGGEVGDGVGTEGVFTSLGVENSRSEGTDSTNTKLGKLKEERSAGVDITDSFILSSGSGDSGDRKRGGGEGGGVREGEDGLEESSSPRPSDDAMPCCSWWCLFCGCLKAKSPEPLEHSVETSAVRPATAFN